MGFNHFILLSSYLYDKFDFGFTTEIAMTEHCMVWWHVSFKIPLFKRKLHARDVKILTEEEFSQNPIPSMLPHISANCMLVF